MTKVDRGANQMLKVDTLKAEISDDKIGEE